ncbi:MAG: PspA/IM30 family protein, partial [Chloroflexota bacterium]
MAQSLFQKVQTLISANMHSMVDSALDANSVAVLDEYIRQAENNLDDLEDALVTVKGQVRTLKRKYETYRAEAEALDADIDRLLGLGKEDLAVAAQSQYNSKADLAEEYKQQFLNQKDSHELRLYAHYLGTLDPIGVLCVRTCVRDSVLCVCADV